MGDVKFTLHVARRIKENGNDPHRLLASFQAVADGIIADEQRCRTRKVLSAPGVARNTSQLVISIISMARIMPRLATGRLRSASC